MEHEEEIIRKIKRDKKYFALIYQEYYEQIYNYVYGFLKNKENAEDISSVTFEKALKGIDSFQWEGISIQSWLYKIARNTVNDFYRKKQNRVVQYSINQPIAQDNAATLEDIMKSSDDTLEVQIIKSDEEEKLYAILQHFSESDQYLLYYKYFETMNNKEIAKIMQLSETNVGTKLQRLRIKLKELL